ncbi:hypothetical protein D3C85_1832060 [compost metagenome]
MSNGYGFVVVTFMFVAVILPVSTCCAFLVTLCLTLAEPETSPTEVFSVCSTLEFTPIPCLEFSAPT